MLSSTAPVAKKLSAISTCRVQGSAWCVWFCAGSPLRSSQQFAGWHHEKNNIFSESPPCKNPEDEIDHGKLSPSSDASQSHPRQLEQPCWLSRSWSKPIYVKFQALMFDFDPYIKLCLIHGTYVWNLCLKSNITLSATVWFFWLRFDFKVLCNRAQIFFYSCFNCQKMFWEENGKIGLLKNKDLIIYLYTKGLPCWCIHVLAV